MAWDTTKAPNDPILSADWNAHVSDQKTRGIPSVETKNGSDCSGTEGALSRQLTLANTIAIKTGCIMIFRNGSHVHSSMYSITNSPPNDVITFSGLEIFNSDLITVYYFT